MPTFVHLHVHSDGSLQDGISSVKRIVEKTKALDMPAVSITDHGRAGSLLDFYKTCRKNEIKPLLGLEAYVAPRSHTLKEPIDGLSTSYHLTLLAKNATGLKNIFRLTSLGWLEGFYYRPRVSIELLKQYREGLVVLSGCGSGYISKMFLDRQDKEAYEHAKLLREIYKDDFYIEIQDHGIDWQAPLKEKLIHLSNQMSIPAIATQDSHFIEHDEYLLHQKVCRLTASDLEFSTTETYFKSYDEMLVRFGQTPELLHRTAEVAEKCNVEWDYGRTIWPVYPLEKTTPDEELERLATEGFHKLFGEGTEVYKERFRYELAAIKETGFATYFLVVQDFINWAKDHSIPIGPGRGSAASSLVCYCLGITNVDPIKYKLFFERFISAQRVTNPDIDIDMCPHGRKKVLQYVMGKYGEDRVCQIGTYGAFKPRGSLRDFARVCGYPPSVGAELAKLIPPDVAGKALTFDEAIHAEPKLLKTGYPEVVDFARKAEGLRTKAGVHAAGVVIADRPLTEVLPLFKGKSDETATQFDMHDVEELGLVKYDFLGLINLTIIDDTIKLIEKTKRIRIDINNIDREDQAVYENIFQKGELDGVFQFETSSGFKDLCVRVKPSSIEDLSVITSIFRPGPIGAGLLEQYIARRNGASFEYPDPRLEPVLKDTFGIYCFQENIMQICVTLAGYTASEADDLRKGVGKKLAAKVKEHREKFIKGCISNNVDEEAATKLFDDIEGYSKYAFALCHATAYSIISFATAWLKYYYKEEFYCSLFNNTLGEQDQLVKYIYSCRQQGIPIQPPDINKSYAEFTLDNGTIIFGLAGVKGIGEKACQQFLEKRPEDGIQNLDDLFSLGMNQGILKSLARCGALEGISEIPSSQLEEAIETLATYYKKLATWEERKIRYETREEERQSCIDTGEPPPKRLPKLPNRPEFPAITEIRKISRAEKLALEHDTLGFYLTGHPLDDYPSLTRMASCTIEEIIEDSKGGEVVTIPAVVSILERRRTRKGQDMANIILEDRTGRIEATIFPKTWVKVKDTFDVGQIVITSCKIDREVPFEEGATTVAKLYLQTISPIKNEDYIMAEMSNLKMGLHDGSSVWFITDKETDFNKWQKAKALIQNLE